MFWENPKKQGCFPGGTTKAADYLRLFVLSQPDLKKRLPDTFRTTFPLFLFPLRWKLSG
jgi:hypothetical protein